ncbi:unnamed protein product, partial [Laminaria digitata]
KRAEGVRTAVERALAGVGRPSSGGAAAVAVAAAAAVARDSGGVRRQEGQECRSFVMAKATAERATDGGVGRVGAFEVQVTACLLAQAAQNPGENNPRQQPSHRIATNSRTVGIVRSKTVSSKLCSGKWPTPDGVATKVINTLRDWGALL